MLLTVGKRSTRSLMQRITSAPCSQNGSVWQTVDSGGDALAGKLKNKLLSRKLRVNPVGNKIIDDVQAV